MKVFSFIGLLFLLTLSSTNATRCSYGGSPACAKNQNDYRVFLSSCYVFSQNFNSRTGEKWVTKPMSDCFNAGCTPHNCVGGGPINALITGIIARFANKCDFLNFACRNYSLGKMPITWKPEGYFQ